MSNFTHLHECRLIMLGLCNFTVWYRNMEPGKNTPLDKIHHRPMRFLLGVHRFTPFPALYGDTGWLKPRENRYLCQTQCVYLITGIN